MDYELAKQLKDAGFPQGENRPVAVYSEKSTSEIDVFEVTKTQKVYIPTLSELIEACGDKFRKLILHSENPKHPNLIWQAGTNQHIVKNIESKRGKTPEIAVANLYLALNKKQYEN